MAGDVARVGGVDDNREDRRVGMIQEKMVKTYVTPDGKEFTSLRDAEWRMTYLRCIEWLTTFSELSSIVREEVANEMVVHRSDLLKALEGPK
jgi:hypothetical protein